MAQARVEPTLVIEIPNDLYFEYTYATQDDTKPATLRLGGSPQLLKSVLEDALRALDGV